MLAIIGGSGLSELASLEVTGRRTVHTPFGEPSSPLTFGRLGGVEMLFLARHGVGHTLAPHEINYRANLWALRDAGASEVIAVNSVGGTSADFGPGVLAIPDNLIDYTSGRALTFFEGADQPVTHVDFTWPYTAAVREALLRAAQDAALPVHDGGVFAVTNGPRLESAAEINRLERDGADLVGMTAMPEAVLARELDLPFAVIALVVNWAAGRGDSAIRIELADIARILDAGMVRVRRIIEHRARQLAH